MKAQFLGAALLALALAGCGGESDFTIGGSITNLKNAGLVLANGDDTLSVPVGATSYSFPKTVAYGDNYSVVITKQPDHMTCTPTVTSGAAGQFETISVPITCAQNTYAVNVTVTGLTAEGLQLVNGSSGTATVTVAAPTASFTSIPVGTAYGITIYNQPTGQTCTIANGAGVMGDADRSDAVVTCVKNS
ncbi:hypothetical protein IP91_04622 [Pseudoduganella lurida]|uniref:Lipoprotein n=1 Tax=Pseudoduganella lurida TaxID=1036180 RepID=A0A562QXL8_9BURK|nr:hypothetical protein [Pseudoduganella lurida]TWI61542.1 hypothetical protein IP91_04622 [Pseudoduganella lurida]